jgi:hypothetical protein
MTDIVERLRKHSWSDAHEAADYIEQLEGERGELKNNVIFWKHEYGMERDRRERLQDEAEKLRADARNYRSMYAPPKTT